MGTILERDVAVAEFIRKQGVTRCPTVCVAPTQGCISTTDQRALRRHEKEKKKRHTYPKMERIHEYWDGLKPTIDAILAGGGRKDPLLIASLLNSRGIPNATGGKWDKVGAWRLLCYLYPGGID